MKHLLSSLPFPLLYVPVVAAGVIDLRGVQLLAVLFAHTMTVLAWILADARRREAVDQLAAIKRPRRTRVLRVERRVPHPVPAEHDAINNVAHLQVHERHMKAACRDVRDELLAQVDARVNVQQHTGILATTVFAALTVEDA